MLMMMHYDDRLGDDLSGLLDEALRVLGRQPGFAWGCVGRSPDEPRSCVLTVRWDTVGAMRRGMGHYEARVRLGALQRYETPKSGTFEILAEQGRGGYLPGGSDRHPDADSAGPGLHQ